MRMKPITSPQKELTDSELEQLRKEWAQRKLAKQTQADIRLKNMSILISAKHEPRPHRQ